jgi:glucose dehydrogenase
VTGVKRGHEAAPLVVGDMMYVVTPLPNRLIAFDLKQPGAYVKWIYAPHVIPAAEGVACCDVVIAERFTRMERSFITFWT